MALLFFFVLFTWIAGAFWTAVAGFIIRLTGRPRAFLHPDDVEGRPITSRTALIMCVYNEDPKHFAAGVDAIWTSLKAQAEQAQFDFFILSDTRKPEIARRGRKGLEAAGAQASTRRDVSFTGVVKRT